jgi:hypothetical protein
MVILFVGEREGPEAEKNKVGIKKKMASYRIDQGLSNTRV